MTLKTFFAVLLTGLTMTVNAQGYVSKKWGKPSKEEVAMTTCPFDEEANAVVLLNKIDIGYDISENTTNVWYLIHKRIKVLKSEGKEQANIEVMTEERGSDKELLMELKASAFNSEGGKLVETKMKRDQVFEEKVNKNLKRTKFTIPQVKEGTIIEYSYKIQSDFYYNVNTWYAQEDIPTVYADFHFILPNWFISKVSTHGLGILTGNKRDVRFFMKNGASTDGTEFSFVGHNLPALKDNEFTYNVDDYRGQVNVDINGLVIPGSVYRDFGSTWDEVDRTLREDDDFRLNLHGSSPWKAEIAGAGIDKIESVNERIAALLKMLHSRVKWNGNYSIVGRSLNSVVKDGHGSSSEMNALFMAMLRDAGMKSAPVVMSRRTCRKITLPSLDNLNTCISGVYSGSRMIYVDASYADGGANILPPVVISQNARVIPAEGETSWVDLTTQGKNVELTVINARIDADGTLHYTSNVQGFGNIAASMRSKYREAKDENEYIKELKLGDEVTIENFKFENVDNFATSVTRTMDVTIPASVPNADVIYINPMIVPQITENPFKEEKRQLPVDLPFAYSVKQNVNIDIPEGYEVEALPKPLSIQTPNGDIVLRTVTRMVGNTLSTIYTLDIKSMIFLPVSYASLREIFGMMVSQSAENVVLRKIQK